GSEIIQDSSVYAGIEDDETAVHLPAAPGPPPGAPADAVDPAVEIPDEDAEKISRVKEAVDYIEAHAKTKK
ncbi:MAG: hypothetical protein V3U83_05475, partial [Acidobacteriota bacterium]